MSYKPPRVSTEFDQGERGEALVKLIKKNNKIYVLVKFVKSEKKFRFRRTKEIAQLRAGRWNLQLNSDETEIWNFSPWAGQYKVKVAEFASKEGEAPAPKTNKRINQKTGKSYPTVDFTVIFEVVEPEKFAGTTIPYFLRYNFREAEDDDGHSVVGLPDSGSRTKQLSDFLDITGAWNRGLMKWQDNVLPAFEKRILREDKEFNVIMKDGWIDTLYKVDELVDESNDWDNEPEEEETAKEPVKETSSDDEEEINWEPEDE